MTPVYSLQQIRDVLPSVDLVESMEQAFAAYSAGLSVVPPVGELLFEDPPGDMHLKYGFMRGDSVFVVKVSTGFYRNRDLGLESNSGLMLVFDSRTGYPKAVLLDEGWLTAERTAAAGATAAKHLAPSSVQRIGILGSGLQAQLQLRHLAAVVDCRSVALWARSSERARELAEYARDAGFDSEIMSSPREVAQCASLIVTTTASETPLLAASDIRPGTHITAVGSDAAHKQELAPDLVGGSDLVVVDSYSQSESRGEVFRARSAGSVPSRIAELGEVISGAKPGRQSEESVTIADLTGVAVQDIAISKAVLRRLSPVAANLSQGRP